MANYCLQLVFSMYVSSGVDHHLLVRKRIDPPILPGTGDDKLLFIFAPVTRRPWFVARRLMLLSSFSLGFPMESLFGISPGFHKYKH